MDVDAYLKRIGYEGSRQPTGKTLRQLHRAHLFTVPFENLDIPLGHRIVISRPAFYDKVVRRRRGGFCYELNGLFGWLLEQLGFSVSLLSSRVFDGAQPGPEFDHLVLLIELEERWIADVGFGNLFLEPLRLDTEEADMQQGSLYRFIKSNTGKVLQRRQTSDWEPQYFVSLIPHRLEDFSDMCHYQQTSPDSNFTRKAVCSLATPKGRITLSNNRLIVTIGEQREERLVEDEAEYRALMRTHFGITLGEEVQVDKLMHPIRLADDAQSMEK
ncbi:MAG: arylamine N-acetyltransferase [Cyanobacteria bacterium P01_A01_bin.123]